MTTIPANQQTTAEEVARLLCIMDSPRAWTCGQMDLENYAHPTPIVCGDGLELSFSEAHRDAKRWHIHTDFDSRLTKYINHYGSNKETAPDITATKTKTAAQIAADIYRRMIPQSRALRAVLLHRRAAEMDKAEETHQMALDLVAASAGYMKITDQRDPYNSNTEIGLYMNRGSNGPYFSARVSQYTRSVYFERFSLPHDLAQRVIATIADYLKTTTGEQTT